MPMLLIPAIRWARRCWEDPGKYTRDATLKMRPTHIENASYTPSVCAERTAFFKAVCDGHRDFAAIAVCGGKDGVITGAFPPCGVCRQVMREFCGDDFLIYMITPEGCEAHTLAEILPFSFSAQKHMHA